MLSLAASSLRLSGALSLSSCAFLLERPLLHSSSVFQHGLPLPSVEPSAFVLLQRALLLVHLSCRLARGWEFDHFIQCVLIFALGFLKLEIWLIDRLRILRISYSILTSSPPRQPLAPPAQWIHAHEELHRVPPSQAPPIPWYTTPTSLPRPVAGALPLPPGISPDPALARSAEHRLQSAAPLASAAHTISAYPVSLSQRSAFPYWRLPFSYSSCSSLYWQLNNDHVSITQSISYALTHLICSILSVRFAASAESLASCCDIGALPITFHFSAFRWSGRLFLFSAWRFGFHIADSYFWPFWASNL